MKIYFSSWGFIVPLMMHKNCSWILLTLYVCNTSDFKILTCTVKKIYWCAMHTKFHICSAEVLSAVEFNIVCLLVHWLSSLDSLLLHICIVPFDSASGACKFIIWWLCGRLQPFVSRLQILVVMWNWDLIVKWFYSQSRHLSWDSSSVGTYIWRLMLIRTFTGNKYAITAPCLRLCLFGCLRQLWRWFLILRHYYKYQATYTLASDRTQSTSY